jgi:DNA-binding NarL/FixJ family response regulator
LISNRHNVEGDSRQDHLPHIKQTKKVLDILVVDDNDAFRADLLNFLENQQGIEIVGEASKGYEAMRMCMSLHPDLILLDISMPGINGFEAAQQIKRLSPSTKIVFVTIHEEETYQAIAETLNVDGFVCKSSLKHDLPKILSHMQHTM